MSNQHTILLVDASGSMFGYTKETQQAIVDIIKSLDPKTHFTLIFFDTYSYSVICDELVSQIQPELGYLYKARGRTPITDSVYKAIQDISTAVYDVENLNEPHKFVIYCDGGENSSCYVESTDLGRAIEHFTDNFGWEFQFIGPKAEEAILTQYCDSIKIKPENVALYANMTDGLEEMKKKVIA